MKNDLDKQSANTALHNRTPRHAQRIELYVFLFLIGPSLVLSFFVVRQGILNFMLTAWATILRDLSLLSLILYFLWRNAEPLQLIGWNWENLRKEISIGMALFIPMFLSANLLEYVLHAVGFSIPATPVPSNLNFSGVTELPLAVLLVIVVALTEETIFRGYLILRFTAFRAGPARGVLLSSAVFALGHGYEGTAGLLTVFYLGLVLGSVYLWRRSLVAPVTMHFLQDFIGVVLLPIFAKG
jgi:membrane protease YdiL (CAAX protease family)